MSHAERDPPCLNHDIGPIWKELPTEKNTNENIPIEAEGQRELEALVKPKWKEDIDPPPSPVVQPDQTSIQPEQEEIRRENKAELRAIKTIITEDKSLATGWIHWHRVTTTTGGTPDPVRDNIHCKSTASCQGHTSFPICAPCVIESCYPHRESCNSDRVHIHLHSNINNKWFNRYNTTVPCLYKIERKDTNPTSKSTVLTERLFLMAQCS